MENIKIIFFDIDGTLVDPATGLISPRTVEALNRLQASGKRICVATGRPPASLPAFEDIAFDAFLTFNGSLCYDRDGIILQNPLEEATVHQVIANAAALGRPVTAATRERMAANGWGQDLADYYTLAHKVLEVAPDFDDVIRAPVYQIMVGCREWEHEALLAGVSNAKLAISWDRAADVIPASGGKGAGLTAILNHYGLTPDQALAFGDGENDVEMFLAVGTGIAMGNAAQKLKAVATQVCRPVSQDGIYHYCLENGLI